MDNDDTTRTKPRPHSIPPIEPLVLSDGRGPRALQAGTIIKGRFQLESRLGEGGMGVVWKALDFIKQEAQDPTPHIALKFIGEDFKQFPEAWIALQREARKAQRLAHPNIITVFDFDRDEDVSFMTMELLEGRSLSKFIREQQGQACDPAVALPIIEGIGRALAYAHENDIVHSDVKPGNIFLSRSNTVKVLDFGIARVVRRQSGSADRTVFDPGSLHAMAPAYASCEIIDNQPPDPRDDIYALACIAYELLAGTHPFRRLMATQARDLKLQPAPIKSLTPAQWKSLASALAFDRQHRTASVEAFLAGFRPATPVAHRSGLAGAVMVGTVLAAAIAAGIGLWLKPRETVEESAGTWLAPLEQVASPSPADFEKADQAHRALAIEPFVSNPKIHAAVEALTRRFSDQAKTAEGAGDIESAERWLELAQRLNLDPALKRLLADQRAALRPAVAIDPPAIASPARQPATVRELIQALAPLPVALSQPYFRLHDQVRIRFDLAEAASVHVFYVDEARDAVTLLLPNALTPDSRLGAGAVTIPTSKKLTIEALKPEGRFMIVVVAGDEVENQYLSRVGTKKGRPLYVEFTVSELTTWLASLPRDAKSAAGSADMIVCGDEQACP